MHFKWYDLTNAHPNERDKEQMEYETIRWHKQKCEIDSITDIQQTVQIRWELDGKEWGQYVDKETKSDLKTVKAIKCSKTPVKCNETHGALYIFHLRSELFLYVQTAMMWVWKFVWSQCDWNECSKYSSIMWTKWGCEQCRKKNYYSIQPTNWPKPNVSTLYNKYHNTQTQQQKLPSKNTKQIK